MDIQELWDKECQEKDEAGNLVWYSKANDYWQETPATVNGVLGGFACLSNVDTKGSKLFLENLKKKYNCPKKFGTVLDCGAGIGRISKKLLVPMFDEVDLVELCQKFLDKAKDYVDSPKVGELYCFGLQDFVPEEGKYDVIWIQWVIGHLTNDDFVAFLDRCKAGLKKNGVIVMKENISTGNFIHDKDDSSVTRTEDQLKELFAKAQLDVIMQENQKNFPGDIFPVKMFALQ